ncbi:hypothetical protein JF535_04790 [Microbulbifer salipaludis]|uniref:Lipoprotein n=1 Tax=Microbulbifer salipaludis TaxID=187980 RepID=A0ABS3E4G3_9GAMM|nr:hypothetical protein [Microbulbifer salipaludis]MBN8430167.1 hypothetical protein [Microbulbifer salipaludis]
MKKIALLFFILLTVGCIQKDTGREYVMVYYDSCKDDLLNLEQLLGEIGVNFSYQIIEPTHHSAKSTFFNKLIKINIEDNRDAISGLINNFTYDCGPNRSIEVIKDKVFSKSEVQGLLKRFGAEGKDNVDLRYMDGKLFILYSE